jgi:hypothetical protein
MIVKLLSPMLLLLAISAAGTQDWTCPSESCTERGTGYLWGMNNAATKSNCETAATKQTSLFFTQGCNTAVAAKAWISRQKLEPTSPVEELGKRFAKDNRLLPTDCQEVDKSLETLLAGSSVTEGFFQSGCVEQAKKQAQRILKENEKRVNEKLSAEAEQQAAKQPPQ